MWGSSGDARGAFSIHLNGVVSVVFVILFDKWPVFTGIDGWELLVLFNEWIVFAVLGRHDAGVDALVVSVWRFW